MKKISLYFIYISLYPNKSFDYTIPLLLLQNIPFFFFFIENHQIILVKRIFIFFFFFIFHIRTTFRILHGVYNQSWEKKKKEWKNLFSRYPSSFVFDWKEIITRVIRLVVVYIRYRAALGINRLIVIAATIKR